MSESVRSDSRRFGSVGPQFVTGRRSMRNYRAQKLRVHRTKTAHNPSLRFKMSLTACGLALPPDDFITCPTNQPIAFGLDFASATLSGFLAAIFSTTFSIAAVS